MCIESAIARLAGIAILPNHPSQTDLCRRKRDTDNYNRDQELAIERRPMLRDGSGETTISWKRTSALDSAVMIQIITARARPIGYLSLW
jgi:hypothetical protein